MDGLAIVSPKTTPPEIPDRTIPDPVLLSTPDSYALEELRLRVRTLETRMDENTELTQKSLDSSERVEKSTEDLVKFAQNATGALNSLNWIIKVLKPITALGIVFVAIWGIFNMAKVYVITMVQNGSIK